MEESVERVKRYLKNFEGDKKDFEAILDVLNEYTESKSDKEIEISDKNVENIETTNNKNKYTYIKEVAEKIVNEYREKYKGEKFCPEPSEQTCMAYEILHLLAEREQDKKRIQELEAENKALELQNKQLEYYIEELKKYNKTVSDRIIEYKKNSISKQKVKDKIEKLRHDIKLGNCRYPYIEEHKIEILQELLEGEK